MSRLSMRRTLIAVAATAALPALAAAAPGGETLYVHQYFSDDSYTEQVGRELDRCTQQGVQAGTLFGTWTPYVIDTPTAICRDGNKYPLE
ncbi:hypothetical protein ACCC88_22885 [Sphingomonas sp. Sphisp140]|uniref:hypothetical protein n=1 Tax=unclassified Sphingomonas TaxID=196159 RepID=UPI0039B0ACBF